MTPDQITHQLLGVSRRLDRLHTFLRSQGFLFQYPNEVLPRPSARSDAILREIEKKAGKIPEALRQFYRIIGSVNLNGYHENWSGCDYPDALMVFPPEYAKGELDDFCAQEKEYCDAYGSFRIPIAPDYYHKEGVSGGMWYGIPVPSESDDPPLLEEHHNTTFLRYLEIALSWGGFPGLEFARSDHSWPIVDLKNAAKADA